MIYFKTRELARIFARKNPARYKLIDLTKQDNYSSDHRWGVRVFLKK